MPVVTLSSPKGGCGKSTTALILATTLDELGASVTLLDCDGNQPLVRWKAGATRSRVKVLSAVSEREILPVIDRERASTGLVVIDVEGAATRLASRAVMRADLVLVPVSPSALDANEAARAIELVQEEETALGRRIPVQVSFNRTAVAMQSRAEVGIANELEAAGISTLKTHLNMRAAFAAMFAYRLTLQELDPAKVNGVDKAIDNAMRFAGEVAELLREQQQGRAA